MKQLRVIHLQQHSSNLSGQIRLGLMNQRIQTFPNHVLLHLRSSRCQRGSCQCTFVRHRSRRRLRRGCALLRRWVGHLSSRISCLLIESDRLESRSPLHGSTTASSATTALNGSSSSTPLLLGHGAIWDGVSPTPSRLTHHGIALLRNPPAATTAHHWLHHWVRRLHTTARTWSLHVHGHARISHWPTHGCSHHSWLSWTARPWSVGMLSFELGTSNFTALSNGNEDRFVGNQLAVHLVDSTGGFFGSGKAHKAETTRASVLHVLHDTSRSNGTHGRKFVTEHIIRDRIVKVLDVEIHTLKLGNPVHLFGFKLGTELSFTLCLFLGTAYIEFLFSFLSIDGCGVFLAVQSFHGGGGRFVLDIVHKSITQTRNLVLGLLVRVFILFGFWISSSWCGFFAFRGFGGLFFGGGRLGGFLGNSLSNGCAEHFSKLFKFGAQTSVVPLQRNIFDVDIGPRVHIGAVVATHKVSNLHFLSINEHTIKLFNGSIGSFGSFVVDISITFGFASFTVRHDFAREDVPKERKGIIKLLVVNRFVQVFNKNVSDSRLAKRGITLAPHDATRLALDHGKVHGIQRALGIRKLMEVHVGIAQRTTGDGITAHTNRSDGAHRAKDFVQERFVHIRSQVTNVERRCMEGSSLTGRSSSTATTTTTTTGGSHVAGSGGSFGGFVVSNVNWNWSRGGHLSLFLKYQLGRRKKERGAGMLFSFLKKENSSKCENAKLVGWSSINDGNND
mmetsp:Transcript_18832/g.43954  ORF Transcript_18832/g.43954 Transcript_18832/m.43954 type:complete len:731 (+) Transcript_18832:191-2383(+)